jgi:hypothetical protein
MPINTGNTINRLKIPFSEVNKRINAFWEVHIQKQKIKKFVCTFRNTLKQFIYGINKYLLYVYSISVNFVYSLFNLLIREPILKNSRRVRS